MPPLGPSAAVVAGWSCLRPPPLAARIKAFDKRITALARRDVPSSARYPSAVSYPRPSCSESRWEHLLHRRGRGRPPQPAWPTPVWSGNTPGRARMTRSGKPAVQLRDPPHPPHPTPPEALHRSPGPPRRPGRQRTVILGQVLLLVARVVDLLVLPSRWRGVLLTVVAVGGCSCPRCHGPTGFGWCS